RRAHRAVLLSFPTRRSSDLFTGDVPRRPPKPRRETAAYRWSRLIQRRPWASALVGTAALVLLALPVFSLRLGTSDESNYPDDTSDRKSTRLNSSHVKISYAV